MRDPSRLKPMADRFALVTSVAGLAIIAVFAWTMMAALRGPPEDLPALPILYAVYWFPTLFYLGALAAFYRTFRDLGRGALFAPTIATGLRRGGWLLLVGGGVNVLVIKVVQSATLPSGFSTGDIHAFRGVEFDPAYLVVMATGLTLLLLARLLQIAAAQHEDSKRLEAELESFV